VPALPESAVTSSASLELPKKPLAVVTSASKVPIVLPDPSSSSNSWYPWTLESSGGTPSTLEICSPPTGMMLSSSEGTVNELTVIAPVAS